MSRQLAEAQLGINIFCLQRECLFVFVCFLRLLKWFKKQKFFFCFFFYVIVRNHYVKLSTKEKCNHLVKMYNLGFFD